MKEPTKKTVNPVEALEQNELKQPTLVSRKLFQLSLVVLPYGSYVGMLGLFVVLVSLLVRFRQPALDLLTRNGLLLVSGLMILSACFAEHRGEAFLQLANFLPYFLFFSMLPYVMDSLARLERVAIALVIGAIPLNVISAGEYLLKSPRLPQSLQQISLIEWIRAAPHKGRAMVTFDHPNAMASYLVVVFGLGLGLTLAGASGARADGETTGAGEGKRAGGDTRSAQASQRPVVTRLIYIATFLNLVGIFCSGSRNAWMLAVVQLLLFSLYVKFNRALLIGSLTGILAVVGSAAWLGIGGRTLIAQSWTNDPRSTIWSIALRMSQERPWLGWGLGNYKFLYKAYLSPDLQNLPRFRTISHPHNLWLLLSSEAGILVTIMLTLLIGYICFAGVRLWRSQQLEVYSNAILLGYLLGFLGCVGFALFDITFFDARVNVVNWLLITGIYVASFRLKHPEHPH